jgi:hypothetical protein
VTSADFVDQRTALLAPARARSISRSACALVDIGDGEIKDLLGPV